MAPQLKTLHFEPDMEAPINEKAAFYTAFYLIVVAEFIPTIFEGKVLTYRVVPKLVKAFLSPIFIGKHRVCKALNDLTVEAGVKLKSHEKSAFLHVGQKMNIQQLFWGGPF